MFSPFYSVFDFKQAHNNYRRNVRPRAANMKKLVSNLLKKVFHFEKNKKKSDKININLLVNKINCPYIVDLI